MIRFFLGTLGLCIVLSLSTSSAADGPAATFAPAKLIKDGYKKLDTPAWLPTEKKLVFTDQDSGKLYQLTMPNTIEEIGPGGRGKVAPDGRWYGIVDGALVVRGPGSEQKVLVAKPADKELSLNDIAIAPNGNVYFTTLKDPEKGRMTIVDPKGKTTVAWDGNDEPTLVNPNGAAVSADGKWLFIGISSYKDKKHSAIMRFPIKADGSLDVAAGKAQKWGNVSGPDGIAVGPDGNIYATAGAVVVIMSPDGKKIGELKIPKGSGSNLNFGGPDGKTLFLTTFNALYVYEPAK